MKCGLLYLSQESCLIGDVSYHSYEGLVVEKSEWETIARDLGVHNKVMLLRNHGEYISPPLARFLPGVSLG